MGVTHNRPSWASIIDRQIASPIPMPSDFVVNQRIEYAIDVVRIDAPPSVSDRYQYSALVVCLGFDA